MSLFTAPEQVRFQHLQTKQDNSQGLSEAEKRELYDLEERLLRAESAYLRPANARLLLEAERLDGENETLRGLIARKQAAAQRLRAALADALAEEKSIQRELQGLLPENDALYAPTSS